MLDVLGKQGDLVYDRPPVSKSVCSCGNMGRWLVRHDRKWDSL